MQTDLFMFEDQTSLQEPNVAKDKETKTTLDVAEQATLSEQAQNQQSEVVLDEQVINDQIQDYDNAQAFQELLALIRSTTHNERDKGTLFEHISLVYFKHDPKYDKVFSKVQTYADWAKEHPDLAFNSQDNGIDLIATNYSLMGEDCGYTAIQCKCYKENYKAKKKDIDSFIAYSDRKIFTARYIVATNAEWSDNLLEELLQLSKPTHIVNTQDLENSSIKWATFLEQKKVELRKKGLRSYQKEALQNVIQGFKTQDRGKLIMACGTGKTFTSLRISEQQVGKNGFVLFLVPSLALLSQTLTEWKQEAKKAISAFAVCSDTTIGKKNLKNEDFTDLLKFTELSYPATTNAETLANEVKAVQEAKKKDASLGMTVVFATYQSIEVVAQAQNLHHMPEFDLIICDEAHRTTGGYMLADNKSVKANIPLAKTAEQETEILNLLEQSEASEQYRAEVNRTEKATKGRKRKTALKGIVDDEEAVFTRIHNNDYVKGKKRLYMTATPKIYGDAAKNQEKDGSIVLYSMDDESVFGPSFHVLNFDMAVKLGCLVDYKVIIMAGDRSQVGPYVCLEEISDNNAARIIGTWKALCKYGIADDLKHDLAPMKRAVGFAQIIDSSKKYTKVASKQFARNFQDIVQNYREHIISKNKDITEASKRSPEYDYILENNLHCSCQHIDGSLNSVEKSDLIDWLRDEPNDNECKILFNVRCLSEGVDVPALDAVIFLSPRDSQVDVVQTVGRVMRRAPGKKCGYVIIPIVTDDLDNPERALNNNQEFQTVWQILNALKSINPNHVLVDGKTGKIDDRIKVVCMNNSQIRARAGTSGSDDTKHSEEDEKIYQQTLLNSFDNAVKIEENIKSIIVKKLGKAREWEDWAQDVGRICLAQVDNIKKLIDPKKYPETHTAFISFQEELRTAISSNLSADDVIEMLAQHIVIKPVLDELFAGFAFTSQNPIAHALTKMLEQLVEHGLQTQNKSLESFYQSVGFRMKNVKTVSDRQAVIVDLFDKFFKVAFPKQQEKLGIVYTPIPVVDFILNSTNDLLKQEFGCTFAEPNVHVLDPFTGTGSFITRLMQNQEILSPDALTYKYRNELHAFEIVPLAYYVASINMESVYQELTGHSPEDYQANNITVLTDTFNVINDRKEDKKQEPVQGTLMKFNDQTSATDALHVNTLRRTHIDHLPLKVIIGNPPYSVGQDNANDDNKNTKYSLLDTKIKTTYAKEAGAITNKNSLYDSYIRAFRWASDRLGEQGIIAFVSNAGWIDSASANGMRKCLQEEFSSIYVYHLKGNARTSGEQRRRESGNVFGEGSRAPVAITFLVKNPKAEKQGQIFFSAVDDYLSREQKLESLCATKSVLNAELQVIRPDTHNDWLNQRNSDFSKFISIGGKNSKEDALFKNNSRGITTSRDAWSFNSSKSVIQNNFTKCINFYNEQIDLAKEQGDAFKRSNDSTQIKWDRPQIARAVKGKKYNSFDQYKVVCSIYRPFYKQWLYNDKNWINCVYQMPKLFPHEKAENLVISTSSIAATSFSALMTNVIPDVHLVESGTQCFPRYIYRKVDEVANSESTEEKVAYKQADLGVQDPVNKDVSMGGQNRINKLFVDAYGYVREDAIKPEAIEYFKAAYSANADYIDADSIFYYIYGILHSPQYRSTYANNLSKELARIPRVASFDDFVAFEQAGRKLADLHVNYESVAMYPCQIEEKLAPNPEYQYRVLKLKYGKIKGKTGDAGKDRSIIYYNDYITIHNIPLEAQEYVVNKKSALDWIVDRCDVRTDKASGIQNDYNNFAAGMGNPKYILELILRIITVSLETMKIVKSLPNLTIHELDK